VVSQPASPELQERWAADLEVAALMFREAGVSLELIGPRQLPEIPANFPVRQGEGQTGTCSICKTEGPVKWCFPNDSKAVYLLCGRCRRALEGPALRADREGLGEEEN
jgi:hypothetical protein